MGKVLVVLAIELALLPVLHGLWLDICTLPLLGGSLAGRLAVLQHAPFSWSVLHWLLGMFSLIIIAALLSLVRSVLRPGQLSSRSNLWLWSELCAHGAAVSSPWHGWLAGCGQVAVLNTSFRLGPHVARPSAQPLSNESM